MMDTTPHTEEFIACKPYILGLIESLVARHEYHGAAEIMTALEHISSYDKYLQIIEKRDKSND